MCQAFILFFFRSSSFLSLFSSIEVVVHEVKNWEPMLKYLESLKSQYLEINYSGSSHITDFLRVHEAHFLGLV
jgi:hypothetical protein